MGPRVKEKIFFSYKIVSLFLYVTKFDLKNTYASMLEVDVASAVRYDK